MRPLRLILILAVTTLSAQSITRVEYDLLPGNLIEVRYTIYDTEPNALYSVDLYVSLDGGFTFPIHPQSVIGDVGRRVAKAGLKSMLWRVLDDLPSLVSDNLVFKVVARTRPTLGGFFRSLVSGNRLTKRLSNGVTIYGGGGQYYILEGSAFGDGLTAARLNPKVNARAGVSITAVPFVYRADITYRNWELRLSDSEDQRLELLSFADPSYEGEEILLHYGGVSLSAAYTPLPVFGLFLAQVGGGVSLNQFRLGNSLGSLTSSLNNPGLFAEVGLQVNVLSWLKINAGFRQYLASRWVDFSDAYVGVGLHIPIR